MLYIYLICNEQLVCGDTNNFNIFLDNSNIIYFYEKITL